MGHERPALQQSGSDLRGCARIAVKRLSDAIEALPQVTSVLPEGQQGSRKAQLQPLIVELPRKPESRAKVVMLGLQALERAQRFGRSGSDDSCSANARKKTMCIRLIVVKVGAFFEALRSKLADRLEHPEPILALADEAFLDEGSDRVEVRAADLLGCLEREPADEHGEPREEPLSNTPCCPTSFDYVLLLPPRTTPTCSSAPRPPTTRACTGCART